MHVFRRTTERESVYVWLPQVETACMSVGYDTAAINALLYSLVTVVFIQRKPLLHYIHPNKNSPVQCFVLLAKWAAALLPAHLPQRRALACPRIRYEFEVKVAYHTCSRRAALYMICSIGRSLLGAVIAEFGTSSDLDVQEQSLKRE